MKTRKYIFVDGIAIYENTREIWLPNCHKLTLFEGETVSGQRILFYETECGNPVALRECNKMHFLFALGSEKFHAEMKRDIIAHVSDPDLRDWIAENLTVLSYR